MEAKPDRVLPSAQEELANERVETKCFFLFLFCYLFVYSLETSLEQLDDGTGLARGAKSEYRKTADEMAIGS